MNEIIIKPKPQNEKGKRVFLIALIACAVTFILSLIVPKFAGIVQLVSLILLCISLYFYNRYVGTSYTYELMSEENGGALFIVRQEVGKRSTTHCRMSLGNLRAAKRLSQEELREYKRRRNRMKRHTLPTAEEREEFLYAPSADVGVYYYGPTFLPESLCLLSFRGRFERADIFIECSDELLAHLLSLADELRAQFPEEEE